MKVWTNVCRAALALSLSVISAAATASTGAASASASDAAVTPATVTFLDDGEVVATMPTAPLAPSTWPVNVPIALTAMRGETVSFQAVVTAGGAAEDEVHAVLSPLAERSTTLDVNVQTYSAGAALRPGDAMAAAGQRATVWIELTIPPAAMAGTYAGTVVVASRHGTLALRPVAVRVLPFDMPYAAANVTVRYDATTTATEPRAERDLRFLLHAHHLSAIRSLRDPSDFGLDQAALSGKLYTRANGYVGPGEGIREGVLAIDARDAVDPPPPASVDAATTLRALALMANHEGSAFDAGVETPPFELLLYTGAACDGARVSHWKSALARVDTPLLLGAACDETPAHQAADVVVLSAESLSAAGARAASDAGKHVWAFGGDGAPLDLRANAWTAMHDGVARWLYDAVSLVEVDRDGAFATVRLANARRGVEDAGYLALARAVDAKAADAIAARMVPRPQRSVAWTEAREDLVAVLLREPVPSHPDEIVAVASDDQMDKDPTLFRAVSAASIVAGVAALVAMVRRRRSPR